MTRVRSAFVGSVLIVAGCGSTTTPDADLTGMLNVVLSDNPAVKFAFAGPPEAALVHHKFFGPSYFHGRLTGTHQISISRNGRDWIDLGTPRGIDLALQVEGESLELHPDREIPAGTYAYLKLTSSDGVASIEGGAQVAGETFPDPVALTFGSGDLSVATRLSTPLFVAPGTEMTLSIDLNAEAWLSEENLSSGRIPATDVETAISVQPHDRLPALVVPPPERQV